jgi:amino acid transporter
MYIAIAAGKDPIYDKDNNYNKALVNGLAILVLSVCAALHTFSRRGGIFVNNSLAIIKVSIVLVLAILGFIHTGGKYLQASGINEPAIPHYEGTIFNITDVQVNNATHINFNDAFVTKRHDLGSYVDSFLFVVFTFTGFDQPFYVLSEVARPRKIFPPSMITAIVMSAVLYILINVSYFCVVPKEVYTSSPANALNMAGAFLHYLFDKSYGQQTAERVMAGLIAVCVFGNLLVMTFTASRVKQEIAKEGIFPKSLILASGQTTPWAWLKNRSRSTSNQPEAGPMSGVNLEDHPEKSPMAALLLHWCTSILLVLVTIPLKPATQYSFLTELYGYTNFVVTGFLVSAGLLYLKLDSFRGVNGRQWSTKVNFIPWLSPLHVIIYFLATSFFLIAAFVPPNSASVYSANIQGYAWYVVPTLGLSSLLWGVCWWFGLKWLQWQRRRVLVVTRTPYIEKDEDGNYVQKAELVEHEWFTVVRSDAESEKSMGS